MRTYSLSIPDIIVWDSDLHKDSRGYLLESFSDSYLFNHAGIKHTWKQDNLVFSERNVIRGLHFQSYPGQAKLIRCVHGRILDIALDVRRDSSTFGNHVTILLDSSHRAVYIPCGFAHGFVSLVPSFVYYKMSNEYNPSTEKTIQWDDPELGIDWIIKPYQAVVSKRDREAKSLKKVISWL